MALKIYEYEKKIINFKQKLLRVGTIKHSSFYSMMKNLNKTTTNAHVRNSCTPSPLRYALTKSSIGSGTTM
jgi:hypothetical protein